MDSFGGVDDRLGRDAADMEAGSAEPVLLDEHRVEPEFAGADRRDIAAGTAADDQDLAAELAHVTPRHSRPFVVPRESGARRRFRKGSASGYPLARV